MGTWLNQRPIAVPTDLSKALVEGFRSEDETLPVNGLARAVVHEVEVSEWRKDGRSSGKLLVFSLRKYDLAHRGDPHEWYPIRGVEWMSLGALVELGVLTSRSLL